MCALVTGVQTCALPIWLLRRDRSFFPSSFSALLMPFKEGCKVKLVWSMCREVAKLNLMPIPRRTHKRSSSSDGSTEFGAEGARRSRSLAECKDAGGAGVGRRRDLAAQGLGRAS